MSSSVGADEKLRPRGERAAKGARIAMASSAAAAGGGLDGSALYSFDQAKLEETRAGKAWMPECVSAPSRAARPF